MAGFDYARAKATADRLIARFGQAGALRRPGASTGPAHNPTRGAPTDHPVRFAVVEWADGEVDGSRVLVTDQRVIMTRGSLAIDPTPADKLLIGGVEHSIVGPDEGRGIKSIAPAGTVVYYELQVRK